MEIEMERHHHRKDDSTEPREKVIIFVDVVGSVEHKMERGVGIANAMIAERIEDIVGQLKQVDPSMHVQKVKEGDGFFATGTDLLAIFQSMVMMQHVWKVFRTGDLAVRISLGWGKYEADIDGTLRGMPVDLAHRILSYCEPGALVLTDAARPQIFDAGLRYKLIRMEADLKGFGMETFWRTNGTFQYLDRRAKNTDLLLSARSKRIMVLQDLFLALCTAVFTAAAIKYMFPVT